MKVGDRRLKCAIINRIKDEYDLKTPDSSNEQYTVNTVAENLYSDIDDEGYTFTMLNELIDQGRGNVHY